LVQYGLDSGLIEDCDKIYITNQILETLQLQSFQEAAPQKLPLEDILKGLLDDAVSRGVCEDDITSRDLFDTRLMGILTPMPREIRATFKKLCEESPQKATDWYYKLSQDTDYIHRYRIEKDIRWKTATEYGQLDITINLSKPEKDPRTIAAAKNVPQTGYPQCLLCRENEGFAGRMNHPARLKAELAALEEAILTGADIAADAVLAKHAPWAETLKEKYTFTKENITAILREEVGQVFAKVLEHAGVYKCTDFGKAAFLRFVSYVNQSPAN